MSFPLSLSNSSKPTSSSSSSSFHNNNNDMHNKPAPRSTSAAAAAATTSGGVAYNGETFKENGDDEGEEANSLSEMSGLLTQADESSPPPPVKQNVSFASPPVAATSTAAADDQTATTSSIIQQQQQNTSTTSHSKADAHAQDHEDFPERGDVKNDDNNSDSDSLSSSSSTSDDDDDDDSVVGIDERRAFNVKRNQARLASLGLLQNKSLLPSRKGVKRGDKKQKGAEDSAKQEDDDDDSIDDDDDPATRRGILLPAALLDFESSSSPTTTTAIDPKMSSTTTSIVDIQSRFPHRERQIQKLAALMEVSLAAAQTQHQATTLATTTYVPAPIFLTGGSGTGKTCITLELLRHYHNQQQQQQQAVASNVSVAAPPPPPVPLISYLDCATLDASTVDEVIRQVVFDLQQQQYAQSRQQAQQSSLRLGKGKKKRKMAPTMTGAGLGSDNQNGSTKRLKSPPPPSAAESDNGVVHLEVATGAANTIKESSKSKESSQMGLDDEENTEKKVEFSTQRHSQQQPSRRRSHARLAKQQQQQQQDEHLQSKKNPTIQHKRKQSKRTSKSSSVTAQDIAASSENAMSHSTAPTAAWKLGRIWKRALTNSHYCGGGGGGSSPAGPLGFWVIDQAHCLFSLQMSGKQQQQQQNHAETPNLLAQILLLPQTLGLDLTIIVISNHLFLDQTRLNMLAEPSKSLATLSGAVQPIRLHFPAYRGISVIQSVLNQPRHCHLITGNAGGGTDDEDSAADSLQQKVYRSFTTALIQSVYDSTTDLKEILRLGRLLWHQYVEPLQADRIDKTLEAATSRCLSSSSKKHVSGDKKDDASVERPSSEAIEGQVLAILNQKILPQMRPFLAASLHTLSAPFASGSTAASSHHELPDLAKYLLLAGYLCQVNRPDRDKHLFSIQKNGRRRKSQATENTAAENVALGSTQQQQQQQQQVVQRIPRLRSFPMERLLSVYVSVVALNQEASSSLSSSTSANAAMSFIEQSERLQSLGNNTLGQHLAYLQSTGVLHEHPPRGPADAIRLSEPRYCCSLTEDEARRVAQTLNFPLDRYLLV